MNLEIKKDSTYTFNFPEDVFETLNWKNNQKQTIANATIEVTTATGSSIQDVIDMTIAPDGYSASYIWDSTDRAIGSNYIVNFVINGVCYNRFFDIYLYPFQNTVTDNDLFAKDKSLKEISWTKSGKATEGTLTTLVDDNRMEEDDFFSGGIIELYFNNNIQEREVINFVQATNTITFNGDVTQTVFRGLGYSIRESFQNVINEAGNETQTRFNQMAKRAYLLIDHTQIKDAIIYKALANYWHHRVKERDDEYFLKYEYYFQKYEAFFTNTIWKYDSNADGVIEDGEENARTIMKWAR